MFCFGVAFGGTQKTIHGADDLTQLATCKTSALVTLSSHSIYMNQIYKYELFELIKENISVHARRVLGYLG